MDKDALSTAAAETAAQSQAGDPPALPEPTEIELEQARTIVSLRDALETKDKRIAELQAKAQAPMTRAGALAFVAAFDYNRLGEAKRFCEDVCQFINERWATGK